MNVGHIAAIFEAQDVAKRQSAPGRLVPAQHKVHAADEMDKQIAGKAGSVFLPAAPACEIFGGHVGVPGPLGCFALPGVPIKIAESQIGRRRIFPRAGGIVAAVGSFNKSKHADDAVCKKLFCFGANDGADALRADLHNAARVFRRGHHGHAVSGRVRHRLLAVDVFSGVYGVHDDLLVPMVGNGGDDAVDLLVVEKFLIAARGGNFRADDFLRERVAAVVKVGGRDALDTGQLDGIGKQAGALHADADDAEAHAIARRRGLQGQRNMLRLEENSRRSGERSGGAGAALEEFAAGEVLFHGALLEEVNG